MDNAFTRLIGYPDKLVAIVRLIDTFFVSR